MSDYSAIFKKIPDGISIHDPEDGQLLDVNKQFCEMLGYSREELLELDFEAIHIGEPPYTNKRARQYIRRAAEEGPQTFEWVDETKDGDRLPVEVHLRQTTIDDELRVLAVVRDISERKRRQRQLEVERERMAFALERTDSIIWAVDLETGESTDYGPVERLFGSKPDGMDDFLSDIIHPDDRPKAARVYEAIADGETDEFDVEYRVNSANGTERWIASTAYVQNDTGDGARQLIGIATDITERKRREQKLQQQNRRLDRFASVVSHDLRNPLTVLDGRLELAQEECDTEHLAPATNAVDRCQALVDDLLSLARQGDEVETLEPVDLASLSHQCWQTIQTERATISIACDRTILAHPNRLQQLLANLYRNAVEHGGEDVTITVGELPNGFFVEDDGSGIPPDVRDRVFEAGYSTDEDGTGFGLSIVQQVVEAHGWDIRVTEGSSGGARFEITGIDESE